MPMEKLSSLHNNIDLGEWFISTIFTTSKFSSSTSSQTIDLYLELATHYLTMSLSLVLKIPTDYLLEPLVLEYLLHWDISWSLACYFALNFPSILFANDTHHPKNWYLRIISFTRYRVKEHFEVLIMFWVVDA